MRKETRVTVDPPHSKFIPPLPPSDAWREFFLAARTMVARRSPGLLHFWDVNAAIARIQIEEMPELARIVNQPPVSPRRTYTAAGRLSEFIEYTNLGYGFAMLLRIMERPESVAAAARAFRKRSLPVTSFFFTLFHTAKRGFAICRTLRRQHGKHLTAAQANPLRPWLTKGGGTFRSGVDLDSLSLYRQLVSAINGPFDVPDYILESCQTDWNKPTAAAYTLLEHWTRKERGYLARRFASIENDMHTLREQFCKQTPAS